jgi:diguanylate cyclase (GGDEF)-like protein
VRFALAPTYLRGRLARRLLAVFVLASVLPVLFASVVTYGQLVHSTDVGRAVAMRDEAKDAGLALLAQLQIASAELTSVGPGDLGARSRDAGLLSVSFLPFDTAAQRKRALDTVPQRAREALLGGRSVLSWGRDGEGRAALYLTLLQRAHSRVARAVLDTKRLLDHALPPYPGSTIAVADPARPSRLIDAERSTIPLPALESLARARAPQRSAALWRSKNGIWRGASWDLFLASNFSAAPLRILICDSTAASLSGLSGLRITVPMTLLAATAFAVLLAIIQMRRYLGPLETLTAAVRELAEGRGSSVKVAIDTGDELSVLGRDFNRMADELLRRAHFDGLTGLANRDYFRQTLATRIESCRASGKHAALLYIDLDEFKKINDIAGHGAGDTLLVEVAGRLRACVSPGDIVARLGGDEFAIVLGEGCGEREAAAAATRIVRAMEAPVPVAGTERRVSASIGIALSPGDGDTVDLLLRNADIAMYQAKERGRNGFAVFRAEMHERMESRISLEVALQRAIERNELLLHYQPIVTLRRLIGVEALARWRPAQGGEVSPSIFVPIAEQSGMIDAIGRWVLQRAGADFARWSEAGIAPGYVSINVAPRQLKSRRFIGMLHEMMGSTGLLASQLQLELTESAVVEDPRVVRRLSRISDLGVRLALDDFGTGYSSLSHLHRLPFDVVKIDRSFVKELPDSPVALQLVRTIVAMARILDKQIVAEGVETQAQRQLLQSLGCEAMQGFLFGDPVCEEQMRERLIAERAREGAGELRNPRASRG